MLKVTRHVCLRYVERIKEIRENPEKYLIENFPSVYMNIVHNLNRARLIYIGENSFDENISKYYLHGDVLFVTTLNDTVLTLYKPALKNKRSASATIKQVNILIDLKNQLNTERKSAIDEWNSLLPIKDFCETELINEEEPEVREYLYAKSKLLNGKINILKNTLTSIKKKEEKLNEKLKERALHLINSSFYKINDEELCLNKDDILEYVLEDFDE